MSKSGFEEDYDKGSKFWLGPTVGKHEIGGYQFIEYEEVDLNLKTKTGANCFSLYYEGKPLGLSADSLEEAMLTAVASKMDGPNSQAPEYFLRMLGMRRAHNQVGGERPHR